MLHLVTVVNFICESESKSALTRDGVRFKKKHVVHPQQPQDINRARHRCTKLVG